ncbi:hypothetical protein J6590_021672 [Homalodisca vitripennis]|nr:hypothetical protein J6590_021672 [Homalodisca vitripennis]
MVKPRISVLLSSNDTIPDKAAPKGDRRIKNVCPKDLAYKGFEMSASGKSQMKCAYSIRPRTRLSLYCSSVIILREVEKQKQGRGRLLALLPPNFLSLSTRDTLSRAPVEQRVP